MKLKPLFCAAAVIAAVVLAGDASAQEPRRGGTLRVARWAASPTRPTATPRRPSRSSKYIPTGILEPTTITSGSALIIPNANLFMFGIMTSTMHMAWMKATCGRLKSDFQYSASIVYNNFPWPENPTEKQRQSIEDKAQKVLDFRAQFPDSSLADLYDPLTMPPALVKAHNDLDKTADLTYRSQPFTSESNRMEFLFGLYEKYTADLFTTEGKKGKRKI